MARVGGAGLSFAGILRGGGSLVIGLTAVLAGCRQERSPTPARSGALPAARVDASYGKRQLSFERNRGQVDARVSFLARGGGYSLYLEPTRAVFALSPPSRPRARTDGTAQPAVDTATLAMRLVGASATESAVGESPLPGKVNYYLGNDPKRWHENIPTFGKVRYSGVYPGVDLVYYGAEGQLEYDFIVAPGADPNNIRVAFDGAAPKVSADGEIVLSLPRGNARVRLRNLVVYQERGGVREPVSGRFMVSDDHQVRFAVADYDRSRELVIDPKVVYSTYLGGPDNESLRGLAVDSTGSAIVVGDTQTGGIPGAFPVTSGAFQATDPNPFDTAFVTKLSPDGSSLVFSTYLGGVGNGGDKQTVAFGAAVDAQNNIYVGGWTAANNFPTTAGVAQPVIGGGVMTSQPDGFVAKLSPTGGLLYGTYLGGYWADYIMAIAVDAAGDAYVTGDTASQLTTDCRAGTPVTTLPTFPTTPNGYQAPFPCPVDPAGGDNTPAGPAPFFAELDPTGSKLLYSTLLAPNKCVDQCSDGSACSAQVTCASGSCDPYCGGRDHSVSVAIGKGGIAYIGGNTRAPNFPTTPGALQTVARGGTGKINVGFIAAFDPTKSGAASLVFSTFLGGTSLSKTFAGDVVTGVAADVDSNVYVTGHSSSVDFPTTPGAYATACDPDPSATRCPGTPFVTKLDPTAKVVYSTYLLDGADDSNQIAIDAARNAYVLSRGHNPMFRFIDAVSETGGVSIQTLSADGSKLLFSTLFSSELNNASVSVANGFVVDKGGNMYVASTNNGHDLPTTTGAFQTAVAVDSEARPTSDGYVVKISPLAIAAPTPDGGVDGASDDGGAAGGTGGAGGDAGTGGSDAGTTTPKDAAAERSAPGGGGCACGIAANDAPASSLGVLMLLVALSLRRRRPATKAATCR